MVVNCFGILNEKYLVNISGVLKGWLHKERLALVPKGNKWRTLYSFPTATIRNYHKLVALNNRNMFSRGSGGQKFKVNITGLKSVVSRASLSSKDLRENEFLASSSFWWLLAFLGCVCSTPICIHDLNVFYSSVCVKSPHYFSLTRILPIVGGIHPDNSE